MSTPDSDDTSPSPTVTRQQEIALEIRAALEAVAERIPHLERPHPTTTRGIRAYRTVPEESIAKLISLVEQIDVLQQLETFDVSEARDTLQFNEAFRPIADQIAALLAALNFTMEARKARVIAAGLRTYAVARGLARDHETTEIGRAIASLKAQMRRSRSRRKKAVK